MGKLSRGFRVRILRKEDFVAWKYEPEDQAFLEPHLLIALRLFWGTRLRLHRHILDDTE